MGYWVDLTTAYWTMDADYIESVWWSLKQIFDKGLLVQDHRVAPYCPRCGTGLSDHELAQGYETVVDPSVYVRFPLTSRPAGRARRRAAGLDDHPVDAGLQHRGRRQPRRHLRRRPHRRRRGPRGRRAAAARTVLGEDVEVAGRRSPARDLERWTLPPAVRPRRHPGRALRRPRRLRHHRGRHRPGAPGPRVRRRRPRRLPRVRAAGRQPGRRRRPLRAPTSPLVGGVFFKKADETSSPTCAARGLLFRHVPVRAQLPALLALPHAAPLLRAAVLVHPHHRDQGRAARARTSATNWFPATIKHGRYGDWLNNNIDWALSRNRYWGTPLPIWRCDEDRAPDLRRLAGRARRAAPARDLSEPRPAPSVRRRRHLRLPELRRARPPGARGHRRLVRLRRRCRSRSGATRTATPTEFEAAYPAALHLRGDRPDPRLVLHADGGRHAGLRPVARTRTCSASATSSTRTAARCPSTWATSSSRSR